MKIKPTHKRGAVVMELGPTEAQLPVAAPAPLFKLKTVLVPLDFSDCSTKALQYAVPFAKQFGAQIVLVYIAEAYIPAPEMAAVDANWLVSQMREGGQRELEKLRARIAGEVKVKTMLRIGHPAHEIVRTADEIDADLILLSTHGRTGFGRVLLGSVAEHVTRYAHCPVLTVRERERDFVKPPLPALDAAARHERSRSRSR